MDHSGRGGPSSSGRRSALPPGFIQGHHTLSSNNYFGSREDCSCTSVSEDDESLVNEQHQKTAQKKNPKKKCQLNQFANPHLHRRLYPEYYGGHYGPHRPTYESELYSGHRMYPPLGSRPHHGGGPSPPGSAYLAASAASSSSNHVPHYLENIILNSHSMNKPQHDAELMKKLSKCIIIPENPKDPAAFTVTPGFTGTPKPPWCSSKPVQKIVGTFVILMSLGILAAVLYVNWSSNTFRPMMK